MPRIGHFDARLDGAVRTVYFVADVSHRAGKRALWIRVYGDRRCRGVMMPGDYFTQFLRIDVRSRLRRSDKVADHDSQMAAFSVDDRPPWRFAPYGRR
jgi:hypothetical protein